MVAEIGPRSAHRIAVGPGDYGLRAWRGDKTFVARVHLAKGEERRIAESDLAPATSSGLAVASKGEGSGAAEVEIAARAEPLAEASRGHDWIALASFGVGDGVAAGAAIMGGRIGIDLDQGRRRLSLALLGGTGRTDGMREDRFGAEVTSTWWTGGGEIRFGAGAGVGSGVATEHADAGDTHWSGLGWATVVVRAAVQLPQRLAIDVAGELPAALLRRDGGTTVTLLPAAWVGLSRAF